MEEVNIAIQPPPFVRLDVATLLKTHKPHLAPWIPHLLIRKLEKTIHLDFINDLLEAHYHDSPDIFLSSLIEQLDIHVAFTGYQRLVDSLHRRPIIVANHPLGGVESLLLMHEVVKQHHDVRMIVRKILTAVKPLEPYFISIPDKKDRALNLSFFNVFKEDVPIIIFPAGYCSRPLSNKEIYDFCWNKSFVKLARKHNRPIVPVHIDGFNSKRFYRYSTFRRALGIKESIESILLVDEMLRKRHTDVPMAVGDILSPQVCTRDTDDHAWAAKIRQYVWLLGKDPQAHFDPLLEATLPLR